jgi:hypothetical protein
MPTNNCLKNTLIVYVSLIALHLSISCKFGKYPDQINVPVLYWLVNNGAYLQW